MRKGHTQNQIPGLPGSKACPGEEKERGREKRKMMILFSVRGTHRAPDSASTAALGGTTYSSTAPGPGLHSLPLINEYMCLSIVQFHNVGTVFLSVQLRKTLLFTAFGLKGEGKNIPRER